MFKRFALGLVVVCGLINASENVNPELLPKAPEVLESQKEGLGESLGYFAAMNKCLSGCWNSTPVRFSCDMVNPAAYYRACRAMIAKGFTGAFPELWNNHKAIIAGSTIITTAAIVAYYNGWFKKAYNWAEKKLA